jgi:hypothetical protein
MAQQLAPGLLLFALGGWGFVFWGVCARVTAGVFGHWIVGYLAHNHGRMSHVVRGAAVQGRNVRFASLLTMGECWHNNHHAFPGSARLGLLPASGIRAGGRCSACAGSAWPGACGCPKTSKCDRKSFAFPPSRLAARAPPSRRTHRVDSMPDKPDPGTPPPASRAAPVDEYELPYSIVWPMLVGAAVGVVTRLIFSGTPGGPYATMMSSFVLLAPLLVGATTVYVAELHHRRSWTYYLWVPALANVLFVLGTMVILIEGLICVVVIVPLFARSARSAASSWARSAARTDGRGGPSTASRHCR